MEPGARPTAPPSCRSRLVALAIIVGFAVLAARATLYPPASPTERIVMRIGIALSVTLNIPFRAVDGAGLKLRRDGTGDISLVLAPNHRIAFLRSGRMSVPGASPGPSRPCAASAIRSGRADPVDGARRQRRPGGAEAAPCRQPVARPVPPAPPMRRSHPEALEERAMQTALTKPAPTDYSLPRFALIGGGALVVMSLALALTRPPRRYRHSASRRPRRSPRRRCASSTAPTAASPSPTAATGISCAMSRRERTASSGAPSTACRAGASLAASPSMLPTCLSRRGRLILADPATGQSIVLAGFGHGNAAVFAKLLDAREQAR